jgi:hypothetical protein
VTDKKLWKYGGMMMTGETRITGEEPASESICQFKFSKIKVIGKYKP